MQKIFLLPYLFFIITIFIIYVISTKNLPRTWTDSCQYTLNFFEDFYKFLNQFKSFFHPVNFHFKYNFRLLHHINLILLLDIKSFLIFSTLIRTISQQMNLFSAFFLNMNLIEHFPLYLITYIINVRFKSYFF